MRGYCKSMSGVSQEIGQKPVRSKKGGAMDGRTPAQLFPPVDQQEDVVAKSRCNEVIPKLVLSEEEFAVLESLKTAAARFTVLGQFPATSPGQESLREWAKSLLNNSFEICSLIGNAFFEIRFTSSDEVQDCLS